MSEDDSYRGQKKPFLPVIESVRLNWLNTCQQSSAIVSSLLAGIAAQLFVFMKDPANLPNTKSQAQTGLIILSYMALVFNCSASITSLILIYRLGELPLLIANSADKPLFYDTSTSKGPLDILKACGIGFLWTLTMYHWLFSLLTGIMCIMGQILMYIFLQESIALKVTMTCVMAFTTLPMLALADRRTEPRTSTD